MLYEKDNKYYLIVQTQVSGLEVLHHLKSVTDGEDYVVTDEELFKEFKLAKSSDAMPEFFEAQWIGEADLEKMTIAMMQEVAEAFNELDWKPWKTKEPNFKAYKEELADVGIFLLLNAKLAGMSLDELLFEMYSKHLYNLVRKDHKDRKNKDSRVEVPKDTELTSYFTYRNRIFGFTKAGSRKYILKIVPAETDPNKTYHTTTEYEPDPSTVVATLSFRPNHNEKFVQLMLDNFLKEYYPEAETK